VARVLVIGATIQCSHGGQFRLSSGDSRLTVDGNGAVLSGTEAGLAFGSSVAPLPGLSPCPVMTSSTPPLPSPCVTGPAAAGMAIKLAVGGTPVLLDSATGTTINPANPGTWSVSDAGQTKLEAS
jgi:hypothetical protein